VAAMMAAVREMITAEQVTAVPANEASWEDRLAFF
jgi:hypothetical protein